jgi:putative sterol carrier protein
MGDITATAVEKMRQKFPQGFDGTVKFDISDAGTILLDADGAREGDGPADCTLTADSDTFEAILNGDLNPTAAFMGGRLRVAGDMGLALRLAGSLG